MKNRAKLRTMTWNGETWRWAYYFDAHDLVHYPYSYYLFVPPDNDKLKVRVYFTRYAPNMALDAYSDAGTVCRYRGERTVLNLCQPSAARQVMEYVFAHCCNRTDTGETDIRDGDAILEKLGYTEFESVGDTSF